MKTRRQFIAGIAVAGGVVGTSRFVAAQETERPAKLDAEMVGKFVGKSHGDMRTVKELLKTNPEIVNAAWDWGGGDWETGLGAASHVGRRDIAELLLENGARLDAFASTMLGHTSIVKEMLSSFPRLHTVPGPHGIPLLSHAIFGKEKADAIFELLLKEGADVNAASNNGMTVLMAAAGTGRVSIVEALLEKGADPNAKDSKGKTAWDRAKSREKHKAAKALERAMKG